jgi:hypothetical protein
MIPTKDKKDVYESRYAKDCLVEVEDGVLMPIDINSQPAFDTVDLSNFWETYGKYVG